MPITSGNKKILDLKKWELLNQVTQIAFGMASGRIFVHSNHVKQQTVFLADTSTCCMYLPEEDWYIQLPTAGGLFSGAGTCGVASSWSTGTTVGVSSLSATAGTTSTITTSMTLYRDLRGWPIHILEGPNAGQTLTISSNTIGSNSVITVPTQASAFSNATKYRLLTPRWYVSFSTSSGVSFRFYDYARDTWTALSTTGLPSTFGTDARMEATPSWIGTGYNSFATGTATSATSTTLVNSNKAWTSGQWVNYQIRITAGTGAGQIRTITASDATSVTVAAWTTTPDSTSTYSIEGNDDFLYLIGNGASTMYRYQISTNTWTTISPAVTRTNPPNAGASLLWISQSTDSSWTNESSIINGRRLYSFRGNNWPNVDIYDIPSNSWSSPALYGNSTDSMSTNTNYTLIEDKIYSIQGNSGTYGANCKRFNAVTSEIEGWSYMPPLQANNPGIVGNRAFTVYARVDSSVIPYIYCPLLTGNSSSMMRMRVF